MSAARAEGFGYGHGAREHRGAPPAPGARRVIRAPLYARLLRLRVIRPGALLCFVYFEGMVVLGGLLALAELASWWAVLALPVAVALVVKLNDVVAAAGEPSRPGRSGPGVPRPGGAGVRPVPPGRPAAMPGSGPRSAAPGPGPGPGAGISTASGGVPYGPAAHRPANPARAPVAPRRPAGTNQRRFDRPPA
jgi:hypothetical protein